MSQCRAPNPVRTHKGLPIVVDGRELTRGRCKDGPRPCPQMECRHNLAADYTPATDTRQARLRLRLLQTNSCALDVADANPDGLSYSELGLLMGMTSRNVNYIVEAALRKIDIDTKTQMLTTKKARSTKMVALQARLYLDEWERIKALADARGVTITQLIKTALAMLLRQ